MTASFRSEDAFVEVDTTAGTVRGLVRRDDIFFGGIPFAEAPVGRLRFRAPVPRRPWSGILDATRPAKGAPQQASMLARFIGITCPEQSEDCLHATVWTPTCDPGARLPVIVFLHGGGFEAGSPSNPLIDAGAIVARGGVVFVSLGYRLGVIGFLPLPGRPDNRGLLDQLAGLAWVRDNIRSFGGDPDNVTLVGSSAGATCTAAIVAQHGKSGLFRRAIVQSGSAEALCRDDEARAMRAELLVRLDRNDVRLADAPEALETTPIADLLEAQRLAVDWVHHQGVLVPLQLVLDEATVPEVPLSAIAAGRAAGIDLVAGTTRDELRLWRLAPNAPRIDDARSLARSTALLLGPGSARAADVVAEAYLRCERDPSVAFYRLATDVCFRLPAVRLLAAQSRHARTYGYVFDWATPVFGGALGVPHAIDVPYLFGSQHAPRLKLLLGDDPRMDRVSTNLQDAWTAFARSSTPSFGDFTWPVFEPDHRTTVSLSDRLRVLSPAFEEEQRILAPVFRELYPVLGVDIPGASPAPRPSFSPAPSDFGEPP